MTFFLIALLLQHADRTPRACCAWRIRRWGIPFPGNCRRITKSCGSVSLPERKTQKSSPGLDKLLKQSPDVVPVLVVQAYIDLYAGRFVDGERRLQAVLSKHPADPVAAFYLARVRVFAGRFCAGRTTCMAVCGPQVRRWRAPT